MRDPCTTSGSFVIRIREADVPRPGVEIDDSVGPQFRQHAANHGPAFAEQVFRLRFPICEHFRREIGRTIEVGLGKVEYTEKKAFGHLRCWEIGDL